MHMHFSLTHCEIRTTQCSLIPKSKYVGKVISLPDIHVMEWFIRVYCALKLMHCCLILTNISFHIEISGSIYLIILDWRGFASVPSGRFHSVNEECSCPLWQWIFCTRTLRMPEACFRCVPLWPHMGETKEAPFSYPLTRRLLKWELHS